MNQQNIDANKCLLCKRLRTTCNNNNNCEFGMYFPPHRNDDFKCALEVYGLTNIIRIMQSVEEDQRQATANSLLFEGFSWRFHPTNGLFGYKSFMDEQINSSLRELQILNNLLKFCKDHENSNSQRNDGIPTTRERGESSNAASKGNTQEKEKGKQVLIDLNEPADDEATQEKEKGKQFLIDLNEPANDEEED
ncbi:unnamed protein product [Trifolium pratense]|uniref:Uncharacterized protein n=1 Tax=Trifolium pratense TaxID=57577 RepID=A0ACB0L2F0_TRIPR|nr:unnamed protein product [Trifolium pratense]